MIAEVDTLKSRLGRRRWVYAWSFVCAIVAVQCSCPGRAPLFTSAELQTLVLKEGPGELAARPGEFKGKRVAWVGTLVRSEPGVDAPDRWLVRYHAPPTDMADRLGRSSRLGPIELPTAVADVGEVTFLAEPRVGDRSLRAWRRDVAAGETRVWIGEIQFDEGGRCLVVFDFSPIAIDR
jgi:hypothetical protein